MWRSECGIIVGLFAACSLVSVWSYGAAPRQEVHGERELPDAFGFRLSPPAPRIEVQPDGTHQIEIEGFGTRSRRPGAPDIPHRTFLVAIPRDAQPTLVVRVDAESIVPSIRPRAVPRHVAEYGEDLEGAGPTAHGRAARHVPDAAIYAGENGSSFPEQVAWLGEIGVLRDQRYVEVHVAPIRYDPRARGLRISSGVDVEVRFEAGAARDATPADPEPRFEGAYRAAFLNYDQGRSFRLHASEPRGVLAPSFVAPRAADAVPRQRILVRQEGLHRLDHAALLPTGLLAHPIDTWSLTNRGAAVPYQVQDDSDGILEPGEWIQFFGQPLTDDPKTALNTDIPGTDIDLFEARDFTDTNTYFLTVGESPQPTVGVVDATPTLARVPPTHFQATRHVEVDDAFRPLGGADPWYWSPSLPLSPPSAASRTDSVGLPGLFSGTLSIEVRSKIRGVTEDLLVTPDHRTRLTVRNASASTLTIQDAEFDGRTLFVHTIPWTFPGAGVQVTDPIQVGLEVLAAGATCGSTACNTVILDFIEVDYRRAFSVQGEVLTFEWPDSDAEFIVGGLLDPNPAIYEITRDPSTGGVEPMRFANSVATGAGPFSVRFRVDQDPGVPDGTLRRFTVAGNAGIVAVTGGDFLPDTVSDLRDPATQADLVVIAHPTVLDDAPGSPLSLLLTHRASPEGGGLTSKIVRIQDIEDEFQFGLPGPQAIRELLRWVTSDAVGEGWADPKPAYVWLLGDGSYDYKAGTSRGSYVPTQVMFQDDPVFGHYTSDNLLAAVAGADSLADLMIGRIPARTVGDANTILQKILTYETALPTGAWRDHALFLSDRGKTGNNPGEALDFETINARGEDWIEKPPYTSRNLRYWTDYYNAGDPQPAQSINDDIKAAVNGTDPLYPAQQGAAVVQYIGHGNTVVWSDDAFFDERINPPGDTFQDTQELTNGGRQPFLFVHNCLTGGFHEIADNTMGENWLRRPGGGAVGVFAPSGLSFNFIGDAATQVIWETMFGPGKERHAGTIVLDTLVRLCTQGSIEDCQNYVLLGDPAMRLALHDLDPPSGLAAVAGNAQAQLSWAASASPGVTYDVYRATVLSPPLYTRVGTGLAGTGFTDTGLVNTATYYYYVVARDAGGFESAWSNFNSDCGSSGPDCVRATPLNPNPPGSPAGVGLSDPGIGTQLQIAWAPNGETDLSHYTVHWGVASGVYTAEQGSGRLTQATIAGLVEGQTYYVAVTATNTSGKRSAYSIEVSDFPIFGLGLRAPAVIDDLELTKSGGDARLTWSHVTTDFYGKPEIVTTYQIFRGTSPAWTALTQIGSCASPCTSFLDVGALGLPGRLHYRVRAVDTDGNPGAWGSEPPARTDLGLSRGAAPGTIRLEWDPVLLTVTGVPVQLAHYAVYASDAPFSREAVRDGLVPVLVTTTGASLELMPSGASQYYSVFAVDIRGNVSPY